MTSTSTTNTLRLYLTNAFGIASKFGDFRHALALHSPDIAIVTETKLTVEKMSQAETAIPGYGPPMRLDRTAQGGGVAVWVRNDLAAIELGMVPRDNQEIIWFTVRLRCGRTAVVAALYRPGSAPEGDTSLMEYLDRTLNAARCHGTQLILAGDFNVHSTDWLHSTKTTPAGEAMEELSAAHHLTQHVLEPTRGNNTLDLVLSDFDTPVMSTVHPPLGRSDHASVITDFLRAPPHREPPTSRCVWRYNLADWPRLKHFFRQTDWSSIITDNIDLSCERLTGRISEGMTTFIPSKSLKLHSTDPVWWTPECTEATKRKRNAWKRLRLHPADAQLQLAYTQATATASACLQRAEDTHTAAIRRRLAAGGLSSREWWSTVKRAGGCGGSHDIPTLKEENGEELTTSKDKAESFARYFSVKCSLGALP